MENKTDILNRLRIPYSQIPNSIFGMERTAPQKLALLYLCRCANQGSPAFPSYAKIGESCSLARRTAIRTITQLVKLGDLIKYPRSKTSNLYTLNLPGVVLGGGDRESLGGDTVSLGGDRESPYKELSIKNHYKELYNDNGRFAKANTTYLYYLEKYQEKVGKPHPVLKQRQRLGVLTALDTKDIEFGELEDSDWRTLINAHFQRDIDTDWNINHFASGEIIQLLFYDCLY